MLSGVVVTAAFLVLPRRPAQRSPITGTNPTDHEHTTRQEQPSKKFIHTLRERLSRFDVLGISLELPGILLLTFALTTANTTGWGTASTIATMVIAVFLLIVFVLHERTASQAILAPHLFKSASFNLSLILAVNTYAVRQACTYFLTVQLQSYGNSPIHTSVLYIPLGISALVTNTSVGRLVPIFGARVTVSLLDI